MLKSFIIPLHFSLLDSLMLRFSTSLTLTTNIMRKKTYRSSIQLLCVSFSTYCTIHKKWNMKVTKKLMLHIFFLANNKKIETWNFTYYKFEVFSVLYVIYVDMHSISTDSTATVKWCLFTTHVTNNELKLNSGLWRRKLWWTFVSQNVCVLRMEIVKSIVGLS